MHCDVSLSKTLHLLLRLVQPRKARKRPNITQKLLAGMLSLNTNIFSLQVCPPLGELCSVPWIEFHKAHLVIAKERDIRIHHECEGGIDKSVPGITIWHLFIGITICHHWASLVMPNGDPAKWCSSRRIFLLAQIMDSCSCSPLNFTFLFIRSGRH